MPDFGKMETQFYIDGYSKGYRPLLCDFMRYFYEHHECECTRYTKDTPDWWHYCPNCGGLVGKVKEEK